MPSTPDAEAARRALLLSDGAELTYRVMRCVAAAGLETHVLATSGSSAGRLANSRSCASLHSMPAEDLASGAAVAQVDATARAVGADLVIATDPATTRFLAWHGHGLQAEVFPVLKARTYERLANKDSFALACRQLGLRHPATVVCSGPPEVFALLEGWRGDALMVKPTSDHGDQGAWMLDSDDAATRDKVRALAYRPILVQAYVEGADLHVLLFCNAGRIEASIAYRLGATEFEVVRDEPVMDMLRTAAGALGLEGLVGFDLRRDRAGRTWLLACHPRFTSEGALMCLLSGYNIVQAFLRPGSLPEQAPPTVLHRARMLRPWSMLSTDRRHSSYLLADARLNFLQACGEFYRGRVQRDPLVL